MSATLGRLLPFTQPSVLWAQNGRYNSRAPVCQMSQHTERNLLGPDRRKRIYLALTPCNHAMP